MKYASGIRIALMISSSYLGIPNHGLGQECSGSECLVISNVRYGTRCGTSTSVEVDVQNASSTEYLRGWLVYKNSFGITKYEATGLLKPGERRGGKGYSPYYQCDAEGAPYGIANTGDENVKYPPSPRN